MINLSTLPVKCSHCTLWEADLFQLIIVRHADMDSLCFFALYVIHSVENNNNQCQRLYIQVSLIPIRNKYMNNRLITRIPQSASYYVSVHINRTNILTAI